MLRIVSVLGASLVIKALSDGGKDFLLILVTSLALLSIPIIVILAAALAFENVFKSIGTIRVIFAGILIAAIVPAILYYVAPNKQNAMAGLSGILMDCAILGALWTISYFVIGQRLQDA